MQAQVVGVDARSVVRQCSPQPRPCERQERYEGGPMLLGRTVVPTVKVPEHGAAAQLPVGLGSCAKVARNGDGACPTPCKPTAAARGVVSSPPAPKFRLCSVPSDRADVGTYGTVGRHEGEARSMSVSQRSVASQPVGSPSNVQGSVRFAVRNDRAAAADPDLVNRICVLERTLLRLTTLWGAAGLAATTPATAPSQQPGGHESGRGEAPAWEAAVDALRAKMDEWWQAEEEKLEAMEARIERKFRAVLQEEALVRRTVESHIDDRVTELEREIEKSCRTLREDVQKVADTCSSNLSVIQAQLERLRRHALLGDPSTAVGRRRHSAALAAEVGLASSPSGRGASALQAHHLLQTIEEEPKGQEPSPHPPADSGSGSPTKRPSEQ